MATTASSILAFTAKMGNLDGLIQNAKNESVIARDYSGFANDMPMVEQTPTDDRYFTMLIDSWGTSPRRVGP